MSGTAPVEVCAKLAWDSAFFGVGIARVSGDALDDARAAAVDDWCRSRGIACVYFLARADDSGTSRAAEGHGFALVDVRVELDRRVEGGAGAAAEGLRIRAAEAGDLPALEGIARTSFTDSRFYADAHFTRAQCDALYARWIRESCRGFADVVLVAQGAGAPAGFVTCQAAGGDPAAGQIGLVGVAAGHRGQGLGKALVRAALAWAAARGLARMTVVTQGRNVASQRLYQRCGFLTRRVGLYYHKWYVPAARGAGA